MLWIPLLVILILLLIGGLTPHFGGYGYGYSYGGNGVLVVLIIVVVVLVFSGR